MAYFIAGRNDLSNEELIRRKGFSSGLNKLMDKYEFGFTEGQSGVEIFDMRKNNTGSDVDFEDHDSKYLDL